MANRQQRLAWLVAGVLTAAGCSSPSAPTPIQPTPPPGSLTPGTGPRIAITAVDGWTNRPAAGVHVTIGAEAFIGDDRGRVEVPLTCEPARIVAVGFLERRVACLSATVADGNRPVTLWAVDSDAEREALRAFAFRGDFLVRPGQTQVDVITAADVRDAAVVAWQRAERQLRDLTSGRFGGLIPAPVEMLQDGLLVRPLTGVAECDTESADWAATSGVCRGRYTGPAYPAFISLMLVDAERVFQEAVALRALLYEFGLRPHRQPGLFNLTQPAAQLSDFERRALHMAALRNAAYPGSVTWPDWDR
jgi:hypothetical protein